MALCNCDVAIGNTGRPGCIQLLDVTQFLFLMHTTAADGTRNGIPVNTEVDQAYITARINDPDETKRWYPTLKLSTVEDVRAEPVTQEIDGKTFILREGTRTFKGSAVRASYVYLSKLKGAECAQISCFNADGQNRLSGTVSEDGLNFYPHLIEEGTFHVSLVKPTREAVQQVDMMFAYSEYELDEKIDMFATSANFAEIAASGGLIDAFAEVTAITTTGFTAELTSEYGTVNNPHHIQGLKAAGFAIQNRTTSTAVVPTTVTETGKGIYAIAFAAQAVGDVLVITSGRSGLFMDFLVVIP